MKIPMTRDKVLFAMIKEVMEARRPWTQERRDILKARPSEMEMEDKEGADAYVARVKEQLAVIE